MIVKLTNPVKKEDVDNYAYVCDPAKNYFVYGTLAKAGGADLRYDIPAKYFTVLNDATPEDWEEASYDAYGEEVHIKSFPEMAHDKYFYDKLMDDDPTVIAIFKKYAELYEKAADDFTGKK